MSLKADQLEILLSVFCVNDVEETSTNNKQTTEQTTFVVICDPVRPNGISRSYQLDQFNTVLVFSFIFVPFLIKRYVNK